MSSLRHGRTTVLHVDDESDFADLVSVYLEREDESLEVITEHSADDGIATLGETDIDCIVSDYQMPGTDGLEFLAAVRDEYPDLPFILFTGQGSEEVASDAISAGVTDYLQKGGGTDQYTVLANRIQNAVARYRAEQQVEQGFHALETAREGISLLDEDGYFTYVNDEYCETVGYDRDELIGEHWELLYPEDDVDRVYDEILPSIPTEGRWTGQTTYVRKDGKHILVDHALSICKQGTIICLIKEMSDGDEDRQHSGPLVAEDAFVECLLDALDDVFYVLDTEGHIVRVNERAVKVTGYSQSELTAMHASDVFVSEDHSRVERAIHETLDTGNTTAEFELVTADGVKRPYEFRTRRLTDNEGRTIGMVGIGRDVSERNRHERQLERQTKQFESFGSVLSHDLRTPLNTLEGRIELAQETHEDGHFEAAEAALERLDTLITDLSTVMREGQLTNEITDVDLADISQSCWETLETDDGSLVSGEGERIQADEHALTRLLENLFRNAIEHGGEDVAVRVGTLPDGFYVEDDGAGIPAEDRDDVFEPGVTTKTDGTGLGLVSVRQIALAHGWGVTVTEGSDGGARFEFTDVEVV